MMRAIVCILCTVATLTALYITGVHAQEQRCAELGADCLCSEPLTDAAYERYDPNLTYYRGANANTKRCSAEMSGYGIRNGTGAGNAPQTFSAKSDTTTLNKMPNRNPTAVPYYLGVAEGWTGDLAVGFLEQYSAFQGYARIAIRFYLYRSANFVHTENGGAGPCTNSKEIVGNFAISSFAGTRWPNFYSLLDFKDATHANGWDGMEPQGAGTWGADGPWYPEDFRDHWTRIEMVIRKPKTVGTDILVYATNVTDGGTRQELMKLTNGCTACIYPYQNWVPGVNWDPATFTYDESWKPVELAALPYRAGTCAGWFGLSHVLVAGWSTDNGQMIGASSEVEGGSSSGYPTGNLVLTIRSFVPAVLAITLGTVAMLCCIMGFGRRLAQWRAYARAMGGTDDHGKDSLGQHSQPGPHKPRPTVDRPKGDTLAPAARTDALVGLASGHQTEGRDGR